MAPAPRGLPTPEEECELHRRLVDDDPTAPPDVALAFLEPLISWLQSDPERRKHDHLCVQAAHDALIAIFKRPSTYRPDQGRGLFAYLRMSALGDFRNALRTEFRRNAKTVSLERVELSSAAGKYDGQTDDPLTGLDMREQVELARVFAAAIRDGLSPAEDAAFDLWLQGERKTDVIARALGVDDQLPLEQERIVKRFKDKIAKRVERRRSGHDQSP